MRNVYRSLNDTTSSESEISSQILADNIELSAINYLNSEKQTLIPLQPCLKGHKLAGNLNGSC